MYFKIKKIVGDEWDSFMSDIQSQSYLKTFFIVLNVFIVLVITYKTYQLTKSKLIIK